MYQGNIEFADGNVGERPITREDGRLLLPSSTEIQKWFLDSLRHCSQVEYFLNNLGYEKDNPNSLHDLEGEGNKLEWEVARGMALQFREPKVDFKRHIEPSINYHRKHQNHHIMYNGVTPNPTATPADMIEGTIDMTVALLENRSYNGRSHTYDEIKRIFENGPAHKRAYAELIIPQMKSLVQPDLSLITDLHDIPNIGLPYQVHESMVYRVREAMEDLETNHGIQLSNENMFELVLV